MVRADAEEADALLGEPHARPFEMRGRPVEGWLRVDGEGVRTQDELEPWVRRGVADARACRPRAESAAAAARWRRPRRSRAPSPAPAISGLSRPAAASGSAATL